MLPTGTCAATAFRMLKSVLSWISVCFFSVFLSSQSAQEAFSLSCSDTLRESTTLKSDLTCSEVGLVIDADGVVLDLGGYTVRGPARPQQWFAGTIEFFGGLLIAVGLLTGYAAFIASGEMAVAYFQVHFPRDFWPILNLGERAVFYSFIFLYIASRGAVIWGIDPLWRRSKGSY